MQPCRAVEAVPLEWRRRRSQPRRRPLAMSALCSGLRQEQAAQPLGAQTGGCMQPQTERSTAVPPHAPAQHDVAFRAQHAHRLTRSTSPEKLRPAANKQQAKGKEQGKRCSTVGFSPCRDMTDAWVPSHQRARMPAPLPQRQVEGRADLLTQQVWPTAVLHPLRKWKAPAATTERWGRSAALQLRLAALYQRTPCSRTRPLRRVAVSEKTGPSARTQIFRLNSTCSACFACL